MFYVASVIAVLVIDIHPTRSRAEGGTLLVIGDSLTYGTAFKNFGNVEPKLKALGTFNQVVIDGVLPATSADQREQAEMVSRHIRN